MYLKGKGARGGRGERKGEGEGEVLFDIELKAGFKYFRCGCYCISLWWL